MWDEDMLDDTEFDAKFKETVEGLQSYLTQVTETIVNLEAMRFKAQKAMTELLAMKSTRMERTT